ncbi:hypothetical protein ACFYKT_05540 [Cytobacillus sp. FJAT-53684]|uniref:Spore protein n=1 Tax=Cytobacillus mangrovibacter TaxID=3299024 RepID=A0ABW6JVE6_9BACI
MPQERMSKKLRQAVQHANETNPTASSDGNPPNTSKALKTKNKKQ